jgi:hypothetical protein
VTTSIWKGVRKTHESGELIFEDNFDTLVFIASNFIFFVTDPAEK